MGLSGCLTGTPGTILSVSPLLLPHPTILQVLALSSSPPLISMLIHPPSLSTSPISSFSAIITPNHIASPRKGLLSSSSTSPLCSFILHDLFPPLLYLHPSSPSPHSLLTSLGKQTAGSRQQTRADESRQSTRGFAMGCGGSSDGGEKPVFHAKSAEKTKIKTQVTPP